MSSCGGLRVVSRHDERRAASRDRNAEELRSDLDFAAIEVPLMPTLNPTQRAGTDRLRVQMPHLSTPLADRSPQASEGLTPDQAPPVRSWSTAFGGPCLIGLARQSMRRGGDHLAESGPATVIQMPALALLRSSTEPAGSTRATGCGTESLAGTTGRRLGRPANTIASLVARGLTGISTERTLSHSGRVGDCGRRNRRGRPL